MATEPFDPERYWSTRLEQNFTLDGVGWIGLGAFNRWMYAVRAHVFKRTVRERLDPTRSRVLDVGSGTGFYVALWQGLGAAEVTGSDLTDFAVRELRGRFPEVQFRQLDISQTPVEFEGSYDAISIMDVLFHIVDDERYAQALENLAGLLAPNGLLVFTENLLHGSGVRATHQTSRSLAGVEEQLGRVGLEITVRRPLFVLMNTPIDSGNPVLQLTWRGIKLLATHRLGWIAGAVCYPLELALTRLVREGPSTEIVICAKR
jgi:SAM-dependent methyltransferase